MRVTGVDTSTWIKKAYTEADFVKDEAEDEFGGGDENPFADSEVKDDDLPF